MTNSKKGRKVKEKTVLWLGFFLVALFTVFVWYRLLGQSFRAEAAVYFEEPWASQYLIKNSLWQIINRYDLQTILFFHYFSDLIKDNMKLYFGVELLGITLVNFGVFALVRKATKSFLAGIVSAALFITHFAGTFQTLGMGTYLYFIQRIPNFALALFSFVLIVKYFEVKKTRYYIYSLVFYTLAVLLAKYSIPFSAFLLTYIVVRSISEDVKNYKKLIIAVKYSVPFIFCTAIFLIEPSIVPNSQSFFQFLAGVEPRRLISDVLTRLAIVTIPPTLVISISSVLKESVFSFTRTLSILSYWVAAIYLLVAGFVIVKYKRLRVFFITLCLMIPVQIIIAIYLRPSMVNENIPFPSRYLYFPSMIISMFWGIVMSLMIQKNRLLRILIPVFLICFFMYQRSLILKYFDKIQPGCDEVSSVFTFIRNNYKFFPDNSVIILTKEESTVSIMFDRFYGERNIVYLDPNRNVDAVLKKRNLKNQRVFRLIYGSGKVSLQESEFKL